MKKIPSFTIDHIRLLRGIYVSRKDEVNGEVITTFDIRMKEPTVNRHWDKAPCTLLSIWLPPTCAMNRNGRTRLSIGAMGCLTGNYLLMKGDLQPQDIVSLMQDTFRFVAGYEAKFPVLLRRIAAITCSTTCPWQNGSLPNICMKCWNR